MTCNCVNGNKRVFALGVAGFSLCLLCLSYLGTESGRRHGLPPSFIWIGYTQRSGVSYGAIIVSNANIVTLNIRGGDLDGDAVLEAAMSGKPYLAPLPEALFPPAAVPGQTSIVYYFPEPDYQSATQVLFSWEAHVKETKLRGRTKWLWATVRRILPKVLFKDSYTEDPNKGAEIVNIPVPPNATNAGPVSRAEKKRIMF